MLINHFREESLKILIDLATVQIDTIFKGTCIELSKIYSYILISKWQSQEEKCKNL